MQSLAGDVLCRSAIVHTRAWGYDSANGFANAAIAVSSTLAPEQMLDTLQTIEHTMGSGPHRDTRGHYADRLIDLDIMAADDLVINTGRLTVPHPLLSERDFYLRPLHDIAPHWQHPLTGLTAAQMLSRMKSEERRRRT